jgi:hypothetical protein
MTNVGKKLKFFLLLASCVLMCFGCSRTLEDYTVSAMFQNKSTEPCYLWVGHSTEPPTSTLVAPGEFRQITLTLSVYVDDKQPQEFGDHIKVNAQRQSGGGTTTQTLVANQDYHEGGLFYLRWDGQGFVADYQF